MVEITNIEDSDKLINIYLDLDRKPVGVRFIKTKEEFDSIDADNRDHKVSYCNSVNLASRGQKLKLTREHQACFNGSVALGFDRYPEMMTSGNARLKKGIYENVETSKSVSDEMKFNEEEIYAILVSPLDRIGLEPDVVIIIGKSYNIMRIIQGYSYKYGYDNNLKTVGLQALCHDLTTEPMLTDGLNISFLCPGTRLVADWQENEMGVGISFNKWYDTVEGVIATTNPFTRNPLKKEIITKLKENNMDASSIKLNENYDTGTYKGGRVTIEE